MMTKSIKRIFYTGSIFVVIFLLGFLLSSGVFSNIIEQGIKKVTPEIEARIYMQINKFSMYPDAKHYFLLPEGGYAEFHFKKLSIEMISIILFNALFNSLFQPVFLCVFTPQSIFNVILFPFFLYGAVKYFTKIPIMIMLFFLLSVYIGLNNSVVESLIRHRLSCELIYLLVGVSGFNRLIIERS